MNNHLRLSRRDVLRLAIYSAATAFLSACARALEPIAVPTPQPSAPGPAAPKPIITSVPITSNDDFYVTSAGATPSIPKDWKLSIAGLVNKSLTLSLDEVKAMPAVGEMRTLSCISNPVGGDLIGNAMWKGVRLKDLLAHAGVKSNAKFLRLESFDNWSTGIPLELAMDEHALLVYEMNGVDLPPDHGAPLRCLFPGRFGMKQPKWIRTITLIDKEYAGFWEKQGWSDEARILPFSRIDSPADLAVVNDATFTMSGVANANETGVAKLEISWDDLSQWQTAELVRGASPLAWVTWKWIGKALAPGRHTLYARVTDGAGRMQTRGEKITLIGGTFPNGADQMHSIILDFKG